MALRYNPTIGHEKLYPKPNIMIFGGKRKYYKYF